MSGQYILIRRNISVGSQRSMLVHDKEWELQSQWATDLTESIEAFKRFMRQHVLLVKLSGTTACSSFPPDRSSLVNSRRPCSLE
jgi:hypothetical protein